MAFDFRFKSDIISFFYKGHLAPDGLDCASGQKGELKGLNWYINLSNLSNLCRIDLGSVGYRILSPEGRAVGANTY